VTDHPCENPEPGVLCMEMAVGAIRTGWDGGLRVWLCQEHLDRAVAQGWDRDDLESDQ
jgi:hypothetical protein